MFYVKQNKIYYFLQKYLYGRKAIIFWKTYNYINFEVRILFSIIGHIDTLLNYNSSEEYVFSRNNKNFHVDLIKMKKSNIKIAVFAIFVEPEYKPYFSLQRTIQLIDRFHNLIEKHNEIRLIENLNDVNRIMQTDKIGALLAIEGADGIFDNSALRTFYRLGVRMISLTWNQRNHLADGVGEIEANGGVTQFGKKIIEEMENLKIIVDVSHLAPAGFWDIVRLCKKPFIASHSNAMSICKHKRNLDNKQIKAIVDSNGLIGINFASNFLKNNKKIEISDVIKHIDYIKEITSIDNIVLGTDYDGIEKTPIGLEDISKLKNLENGLLKYDYKKTDIEKIFYKNWLNFFSKIWG